MEWIKECDGGVKNHGEPNTWDVTLVTDMSGLFFGLNLFNEPIDQWDTSEVTNMSHMFCRATSFNQPLTMDMSKVRDVKSMFDGAYAMQHPKPSMNPQNVVAVAQWEKQNREFQERERNRFREPPKKYYNLNDHYHGCGTFGCVDGDMCEGWGNYR